MPVKSLQSYPTLCNPMDHDLPGSWAGRHPRRRGTALACGWRWDPVLVFLGARPRARSFSSGPLAHGILQARILDCVALPSSGDLPNPRIEPTSLKTLALADGFFTTSTTWEAHMQSTSCKMLGWMNHKHESRSPGEISTTLVMQMIPL